MSPTHRLARASGAALSSLSLLLAAAVAQADTLPTDGQWRGAGGAALSATSGNSSAQSLVLNADMARATTVDRLSLGGNINYGRSKAGSVTSTTTNKWAGFGQYDRNLGPQLFAFGKLSLEGDQIVELDLRSTLAAGLGYKLINTPQTSFNVFGGAAYSTDRYGVAQTIGGKTDKRFSRSSVYLGEESSHQVTGSTSFKQRLELFPGVSGDKAVLAKFSASLGVAMSGSTSLNVGLVNNYNSKPPAGGKKNDLGVFTGVNVKFGAL